MYFWMFADENWTPEPAILVPWRAGWLPPISYVLNF